jgi:hypothetical protein
MKTMLGKAAKTSKKLPHIDELELIHSAVK